MTVDDVLAYPHQIGDALWRIESAGVRPAGGTVGVCGPSGGAGALAALAGADAHDGSAGDEEFVLCASYSGDDEDALVCFEEAGGRGAQRAVVCTAGRLAARAREEGVPVIGVPAGLPDGGAIVYFLLAALACAGYPVSAEAAQAAATLERLRKEWASNPPSEPLVVGKAPLERVLAEVFRRDLRAAYDAGASPDG